MLVLSRKQKEGVAIFLPDGTEIRVEVLDIKGGRVRLGFEAPFDCSIKREEVTHRIDKENAKFALQELQAD